MSPVRIRSTAQVKIVSSAFGNNTKIPARYTCDGENVNPPLSFIDVPANAKSLVLIVDDPDAPGGIWAHWIVFNIDPKIQGVSENSKFPNAQEGVTSFGGKNYGGPCPPSETHRYFFKLYALDIALGLQKADKRLTEEKMHGHILEKAELVGLYSKKY